jgi:hypothetical protein
MKKRLFPAKDTVELRMYNVGLGDCFLLAFPTEDAKEPCYFVIDCGIAKNTPDEKDRMKIVVQDIIDATGGRIHILAVTHEHYDHVSGFAHAEDLWKTLTVDQLWLPWIERKGESEAEDVRASVKKLNMAAQKAIEHGLVTSDVANELAMQSGFLGVDMLGAGGFGAASVMGKAYDIAKNLTNDIAFCEPGEVKGLPKANHLAYVLGPPRHKDSNGVELKKGKRFFLKLLEDEEEMYGYHDIGMVPDSAKKKHGFSMGVDTNDDALAGAILGNDDDGYEKYCPFDSRYRRDWEESMLEPFFSEHYASRDTYRRVDSDWLAGSADLALRAGDYTNNISLVLAFELPKSKRVLLFPGDAQVGNWLSWHSISEWKGESQKIKADPADLLNRVIFYKAGHHGSHNATVREKGLELMAKDKDGNDLELVSYVPVSVPVAHDVMNYCPMPFYPVMKRLQQKTGGEVYLGNGQRLKPDDFPPRANPCVSVKVSDAKLPAKLYAKDKLTREKVEIEGEVPLYTQFTIEDR